MEPSGAGPGPEDGELVARARAGDRRAFELLVLRYQKMVFALARRLTGSVDEADDVTQTSFLNAFRRLGDFRGEASFKTWLYGIALNECRMRHRRSGRTVALEAAGDPVAAAPSAVHALDRRLLARHVERLPTKQRAAVVLRICEDLSFREVGAALGISEASAKVNFFHAVKKLRAWLAPAEEEGGPRGGGPRRRGR